MALLHDPRAGRARAARRGPEGNAYEHGGASVWSTPAFDKDLNLLYITTGNAGNDWYGGDRPGDNLYAASIVAIDRDSGKLKWHFQEVHHDIWDYDSPSAPVLFDVTATARPEGHRCAGQDGLALPARPRDRQAALRDRREAGAAERGAEDGEDAADPAQRRVHPAHAADRQGDRAGEEPDHGRREERAGGRREGDVHAAEHEAHAHLQARPAGRRQLGALELQPEDEHVLRLLGRADGRRPVRRTSGSSQGKGFAGIGAIAGIGYNESSGTLTAIDATDGSVAWQKTWPDACYSGTVSTAGNVVFVGRNSGELQAYDATNGDMLWSFQTGAGANDTATVFEQDGKQYVAFLSAGNSLVATAHGDSLWLFSLDGTLGPAAAPGAGTGTEHAGEGGTTTGDAAAGKTVFSDNCAGCHGALGTGGNGGPDLTAIPSAKDMAAVVKQVTNGGGGMPAFKGQLTEQQIQDVSAYVTSEITNK